MKTYKIPRYTIRDTETQAGIPWNINQVNAPSFWPHTKGGGMVVAVIDTGLDVSHPEFAGRVIGAKNFTNAGGQNDVTDVQGHGTHVAGIIAGATCGVAPEARIMPLKVFGDTKVNENIYEAMVHVLQYNKTAAEADKVIAINCSFGAGFYDVMMAYAIRRLVSTGVSVVVAAGNQGDGDAGTHEIFSFPAYIWECVTTGATNQDGTGAVYSNSFDGIDIGAPGTLIYSAWPGGGFKLLSGTSMATPHVTGAYALIYDIWRKKHGHYPTENEAFTVLMKHIRGVDIAPELVGAGVLDLTWKDGAWSKESKGGYLWIGEGCAEVDGKEVKLDYPPFIVPEVDRTMVPLRFMAESFGYGVEWNESLRRIHFWK